LGPRQSAKLAVDANSIIVNLTSGDNVVLIWTGGLSMDWNGASQNFIEQATNPQVDTFAHLDYVRFGETGAGTVNVIGGNKRVSGMEVTGGAYIITGNDIQVVNGPISGDRFVPTGKLLIASGAQAEFRNRATFINGMTVSSGGKAILGEGGSFGGMAIENEGTVEINRPENYV
jgi:hypothetical protein